MKLFTPHLITSACDRFAGMFHIPFHLQTASGTLKGFLKSVDYAEPPKHFHVMEQTARGQFYCGQLMLNSFKGWWLPDSKLQEYAAHLGNLVECWYE